MSEEKIKEVEQLLKLDLSILLDREKKVLYLRYRDGLSQRIIGEKIGLCKERIRQIENKALRKLRKLRKQIGGDTVDNKQECKFCDVPVYVKSKTDENEYLELPINFCPMCGSQKE